MLIIGNWKMNPSNRQEAENLAAEVDGGAASSKHEVIVCPPFVYLYAVRNVLHHAKLGAQDLAAFANGAYTGEVSASQLSNLGVNLVIIGHSERRQHLAESNDLIKLKVEQAINNKILPVLCVGAGLGPADDEAKIRSVIRRQIESGLPEMPIPELTVAYEPTWAIGSGKIPTTEHVQSIAGFIRSLVEVPHVGQIKVLYGGSVNSANIHAFSGIDGFLIGGASLDALEFNASLQKLDE